MAQVQQANVTPLSNGVVASENGATVNGIDVEIQNGNTTPTKDAYEASSSHDIEEQVQLSPASLRRRSTRASALKAQEKIKLKDDVVQSKPKTEEGENGMETEAGDDDAPEDSDVPPKKRKLENGKELDQFCFRFGLRTDDDGDVYAMTDESENSSIHSSEMAVIHAHHEKMLSREMTAEQLNERIMMRKEAESQLRIEEAKLALLKRMKQSQTCAIQKLTEAKKMTANIPNLNNTAYKPIFAPPLNKSSTVTSNGKPATAQPTKNAALLALAGMTTQQQQELLARLAQSSTAAQQALLQSKKSGNSTQIQQMLTQLILNAQQQMNKDKEKPTASSSSHINGNIAATSSSSSLAAAQTAAANSLSQAQAKLMASQTPQQRSLAARMAFRAQADKQLMMVSAPKAPPPDMFFIPNPSQPAFTYLLGLDLVVSRVLKDKTLEKKYTDEPYECEECHTDFTPSWKAIGSSPDELHLYCEQCVRTAQKRKIRLDHTNFLKKAYQKISTQEKEFEKKIAEGTLEQVFEQSRPSVATPNATASTSSATTSAVNRLTQNSSGSGTSTPKSSTPATSSTPKASSSSSSSKKTPTAQQAQNAMLQQLMNSPMAAGLMRNTNMMQQMMKMSMLAAAQAQQAARNVNMPNVPNMAQMMQLMAAQQQQVQQQQQQQNNSSSAAAAAVAAQQQQIAAISALMGGNGANAAGMMNSNVNMMLQQLSASQQKQFFEAFRGGKK